MSPVIDHVPKGINATILAYGQTGTGKTYTMFGYKNEARELMEDRLGVIPRAVD